MTNTRTAQDHWTIAYRNPRANRFVRVSGISVSWHEAGEIARRLLELRPALQVWLVPTAAAEVAVPADSPLVDDIANVMMPSGKRVRIVEGELPAGVELAEVVNPDAEGVVEVVREDAARRAGTDPLAWPCGYCKVGIGAVCVTTTGTASFASHADRLESVRLFKRYGIRSAEIAEPAPAGEVGGTPWPQAEIAEPAPVVDEVERVDYVVAPVLVLSNGIARPYTLTAMQDRLAEIAETLRASESLMRRGGNVDMNSPAHCALRRDRSALMVAEQNLSRSLAEGADRLLGMLVGER